MQDPALGQVDVAVYDCRNNAAPGVQIALSPGDSRTQGFSPSGTATTTTDQTGFVFFANVPAGTTQVTATPLALGKPWSQVTVAVHPGMITLVPMVRTPTP